MAAIVLLVPWAWSLKCRRKPMQVCTLSNVSINIKHYIYNYIPIFTAKLPSISFYPDFILILFIIGLYVFKSVYGHYVVGPTNVPQDSKEDRGCDVDNVADMKNHIFSYFPGYNLISDNEF